MKRKMVLLPLVVLLLVVLSASAVMADKGGEHHNGGCVAFCARAKAPLEKPDPDDPDTWIWTDHCWRDLCGHKYDTPCSGHDECGAEGCVLLHGEDTHGRGKKKDK
jgi:hypothetical protein